MRLLHAADVRALDRRAIESFDVPGVLLMENAGAGATRALIQAIRHKEKKTIAIFAGPGNNGGDGYVMARHLLNAGYRVHVYLCVAPEKIGGDALVNYRILVLKHGSTVRIPRCLHALVGMMISFRIHFMVVTLACGIPC